MTMQVKFFEGELQAIQDKFNQWSDGSQYVSETSMHFSGKDRSNAVMKVVYGVNEQQKGGPEPSKKPVFNVKSGGVKYGRPD